MLRNLSRRKVNTSVKTIIKFLNISNSIAIQNVSFKMFWIFVVFKTVKPKLSSDTDQLWNFSCACIFRLNPLLCSIIRYKIAYFCGNSVLNETLRSNTTVNRSYIQTFTKQNKINFIVSSDYIEQRKGNSKTGSRMLSFILNCYNKL
jgi:hypothetical protein